MARMVCSRMVGGRDHSARNDSYVSGRNDVNDGMQSLQKIKQISLVDFLIKQTNTLHF
jgi:hypothetical protein